MIKEDATPAALANLTEEIGRDLLKRAKDQYGFPHEHLTRIEKALSGQLADRLTVMRMLLLFAGPIGDEEFRNKVRIWAECAGRAFETSAQPVKMIAGAFRAFAATGLKNCLLQGCPAAADNQILASFIQKGELQRETTPFLTPSKDWKLDKLPTFPTVERATSSGSIESPENRVADQSGYLYHVTCFGALAKIIQSGGLDPHKGGKGGSTDLCTNAELKAASLREAKWVYFNVLPKFISMYTEQREESNRQRSQWEAVPLADYACLLRFRNDPSTWLTVGTWKPITKQQIKTMEVLYKEQRLTTSGDSVPFQWEAIR